MASSYSSSAIASQVGSHFVQQYYQVLRQQPEFVHQFYTGSSTMIRVDGESAETASAVATFSLALQEKEYFVMNDIFHFVSEKDLSGNDELKKQLYENIPQTFEDMIDRVKGFVRGKKAIALLKDADTRKSSHSSRPNNRKRNSLKKMKLDNSNYQEFHEDLKVRSFLSQRQLFLSFSKEFEKMKEMKPDNLRVDFADLEASTDETTLDASSRIWSLELRRHA
ncbi:hypothetical protein L1987_50601 [Smallanthus sonchifolius]|uniref:Uncharacterized protein n=1 Tax=Smallanthus sonchifolius TaxID=185202 RepID=A0ACB9ENA9_9ASTR|nr:hypothetical protein L1987_50601 [Smallanthus sonchifolius]